MTDEVKKEAEISLAIKEGLAGEDYVKLAVAKIVREEVEERVGKVYNLIRKERTTRQEIKDAQKKLEKAEKSLEKTQRRLERVRAGDFSALDEPQQQQQDAQKVEE